MSEMKKKLGLIIGLLMIACSPLLAWLGTQLYQTHTDTSGEEFVVMYFTIMFDIALIIVGCLLTVNHFNASDQ